MSPGQACVFYDGAQGQARVLGGGFIRAAAATAQGGLVLEAMMGAALDRDTIEKAYARWAPVYDLVFGAVFEHGRMASIAAAEAHVGPGGGRILEVGVGTGISLLGYRPQQSHRRHRHLGADAAPRAGRASSSTSSPTSRRWR